MLAPIQTVLETRKALLRLLDECVVTRAEERNGESNATGKGINVRPTFWWCTGTFRGGCGAALGFTQVSQPVPCALVPKAGSWGRGLALRTFTEA